MGTSAKHYINAIRDGENVVIATPTASGKSLVYTGGQLIPVVGKITAAEISRPIVTQQ